MHLCILKLHLPCVSRPPSVATPCTTLLLLFPAFGAFFSETIGIPSILVTFVHFFPRRLCMRRAATLSQVKMSVVPGVDPYYQTLLSLNNLLCDTRYIS